MIFSWVFVNEMIKFCIEKINGVRMNVRRRISEEVHDGHLVGILYDGVGSCFCM